MHSIINKLRLNKQAIAQWIGLVATPTALALLLHLAPASAQPTVQTRLPIDQRPIERFYAPNTLELNDAAIWGDTAALSSTEGLLMTTLSNGFTQPFPGIENTSLLVSSGPLDYNQLTGELWVGNNEGLWRYQQGQWSLFRQTGSIAAITALVSDSANALWVLTATMQLYHFDGVNWRLQDTPLMQKVATMKSPKIELHSNHRTSCWISVYYEDKNRTDASKNPISEYYFQRLGSPTETLYARTSSLTWYSFALDSAGTPWIMHYKYFDSTGVEQIGTAVSSLINDSLKTILALRTQAERTKFGLGYHIHAAPQGIYIYTRNGLFRIVGETLVPAAPPHEWPWRRNKPSGIRGLFGLVI